FDEEVSEVHVVSERSDGVAGVDAGTELPEAAVADIRPHGTGRGAVRGEDLDDTARGVAIERGEGSTEHLDPLRGVQVELRDLSLAVGPGLRYAVLVDAYAADAECRVCPDTADGDLLVLRVVVAIAREEPRHEADVIGEIDPERILAQR